MDPESAKNSGDFCKEASGNLRRLDQTSTGVIVGLPLHTSQTPEEESSVQYMDCLPIANSISSKSDFTAEERKIRWFLDFDVPHSV